MVTAEEGMAEYELRYGLRPRKAERICNHVPIVLVQRIVEAAQSWLLLREIEQRFGDQDGAVGRDMRSAEARLRAAISILPPPPKQN